MAQQQAQAMPACGSLSNAFGPHDYRKDRGEPLYLVESAHFTAAVEALIRGTTSKHPGADLDYTLRAFPNHHRALVAMLRLAEREKTARPRNMNYTVDCYFDRAIRWQPTDLTVRMIYAEHLGKQQKTDLAKAQVAFAVAHADGNPFTHYNAGLVYFDLKMYDEALAQAHRAMELGFPRTELQEKLRGAGKWAEPVAQTAGEAASSAAPASAAASQP